MSIWTLGGNMKFIEDVNSDYNEIIGKKLIEYNEQFIDASGEVEGYFYAFHGDEFVGGTHASLFLDLIRIDDRQYYKNLEVLKKIIVAMRDFYSENKGASLYTEVKSRATDYEMIGFNFLGEVEGTPKTNGSFHLRVSNIDFEVSDEITIISSKNKIEKYDSMLMSFMEDFEKENNLYDSESKKYSYVALENEEFAGGIQVIVSRDSMYITKLVTLEEFKGNQIGTSLMNMIEKKAKELNVFSISTGTMEFQARNFYEKMGYEVALIKEKDAGKYASYKMVKKIEY